MIIRTIITDWGEIDLCKNNEFNPQRLIDDPENFVFWRYYIDIEQKNKLTNLIILTKLLNF